jgi:carbamoyl-phosphate synthase large subunit
MDFKLLATEGTYSFLSGIGIDVELMPNEDILDYIKNDKIQLVVNTPTKGKTSTRSGFNLRRTAIEYNIPCVTSLDTTQALLQVIEQVYNKKESGIYSLDEYSRRQ